MKLWTLNNFRPRKPGTFHSHKLAIMWVSRERAKININLSESIFSYKNKRYKCHNEMQAKDINRNTKINMKNKEFCSFCYRVKVERKEKISLGLKPWNFKIQLFFLLQKKKCSLTKKNVTRICSKSSPVVFILDSVCWHQQWESHVNPVPLSK